MGLFDFLKRKKGPKVLAKPAPGDRGRQTKSTGGYGRGRKGGDGTVSYQRIHTWIESRIGPLKSMPEPVQKDLLTTLIEDERRKYPADLQADPQAGLKAYIKSNAYRTMLE